MYGVGTKVFVRTVTYHYTGEIVSTEGKWLKLKDAAWVADSGRWGKALAEGTLSEVEVYPNEVLINVDSIVDVSVWNHPLPRETK